MIRKLMASTAVLALVTMGASSALSQTDTNTQKPAAVEQPAAGTDQGATAAAPDKNAATTDTAAGDNDATLTPDEPTLATAFIGRSVYSSEDPESDNIGDVNDLIIGDNGEITQAVVGVGGFLGIGEKDVAVPFNELKVVEKDGDIRLIYSATKEQLEAAEAFDRTAFDPRARFQETQAANQPADTTGTGGTMAPAPSTDTAAAPATEEPAASTDTAAAPATDTSTNNTSTDMTAAAPAAKPATTTDTAAATTETAPSTDTATAPATTTDQQTAAAGSTDGAATGFVSFNADQVRASTLMGKELLGPDDKSIGEVADLVLQDDGKTRAAVVDVGGFLGVGEKRVAIPFDQIQMTADPQNADEPKLKVAMTKDQLEQAPEWKDQTIGSEQAANAPAAGDTSTTTTTTTTQPTNTAAADTNTNMQDISADKLIGMAVYSPDNTNIGEVNDVVFDKAGTIDAVVVDVGGFLGVGEKPVAVQFDALNVQKDTNGDVKLMVNASEDQLKSAPAYNKDATQ